MLAETPTAPAAAETAPPPAPADKDEDEEADDAGPKILSKKEKEKREKPTPPVASSSKSAPKQSKAPPAPKGKKSKMPVTDDDVLTFEQKKDLSDTISKLDGAKLEKVIQIIHEGVPEIREVRIVPPTCVRSAHTYPVPYRATRRSSSRSTSYQQLF